MPLMSFHTAHPTKEKKGATTLLPTDHGPGEAIIAGALKTLLEKLVKAGGAIEPSLATGYVVPFDPEWFKLIALEMLDEAGVQFLFHAFASSVLGGDVWDLSFAEWASRKQMRQIAEFLRRYVPGFEQSYVAQSGVQVGVRETRRVLGDYQLTVDDVLSARKFDDAIARGAYPVDIHNPAGTGTVLKRLPPGEAYDIPLRCLMPRSAEALVVAGRCISGTHEAHSSYRVMPIVMATGQAAGVCGALAARRGVMPREVAVEQIQRELVRQGASLLPDLLRARQAAAAK